MRLRNIGKARVLVFALTAATLLQWPGAASATPDIRRMSDYGYVALHRQEGCVLEELWTGLNYISSASLAPGEAWSEPAATAWAWYHSNECTSQDVVAYGETILDPASYEIVSLGDLSFNTQIQLSEVNSGEGPPFLVTGPSDWSGTSFGTVELDLVFTQEGPFNTFNLMNGILIPPPPGTGPGAPGSRTAWLYTGQA